MKMISANINYLLGGFVMLALAACDGGGSGAGGSTETGTVSLGLSDAPIDDLSKVVITIDGIELKPKDGDDCDDDLESDDCTYINDFTEDGELDSTIQVDLMTLQGSDNQIIVEEIELEAGEYSQLRLSVIDENVAYSYVEEKTGEIKELKVPSDGLKLGGFTIDSAGVQVFVLEFDLRKSMTANGKPGEYFRYILKPTGVRVVEVETAANISGNVDNSLFDGNIRCASKADPTAGNVIYIYSGQGLVTENLADNFESTDESAPADAIAPYTSREAAADGSYEIAYLPAGDYTLAFSCEAEDDNPDLYDGIVIPSPESEIVELTLSEGESKSCNIPVVDGSC